MKILASLILGAGVDYAVHLASAWQAEPGEPLLTAAARAATAAGPAIWINAIMVASTGQHRRTLWPGKRTPIDKCLI